MGHFYDGNPNRFNFFRIYNFNHWEQTGLLVGLNDSEIERIVPMFQLMMDTLLKDEQLSPHNSIGILVFPIIRRSFRSIELEQIPEIYTHFSWFCREYRDRYCFQFTPMDSEEDMCDDYSSYLCGGLTMDDITTCGVSKPLPNTPIMPKHKIQDL